MFLDDEDLDARIEILRKGNFTVKFVNTEGQAPVGMKIAYRMTRLGFGLGTVLHWSFFKRPDEFRWFKNYLEKADAYFNTITIPIYWRDMEPERGNFVDEVLIQIWQWCHDHKKATRGHCIFSGWDRPPWIDIIQPWVLALGKQELEEAMKSRLQHILGIFKEELEN